MLTAVETRAKSQPAAEQPVAGAFDEPVHCRKCKRMLFRTTARALRESEMIETKCQKCGTLNYLVGASQNVVDNQ